MTSTSLPCPTCNDPITQTGTKRKTHCRKPECTKIRKREKSRIAQAVYQAKLRTDPVRVAKRNEYYRKYMSAGKTKEYYDKMKNDPEKLAIYKAKKQEYMKRYRAKSKTS